MAVFDPKSRYVKPPLDVYSATDLRGRHVNVLPMVEPPHEVIMGEYINKEGQRLDHLANSFLNDPNGYWRIAEANGAMLPDALAEVDRLSVPAPIGASGKRRA